MYIYRPAQITCKCNRHLRIIDSGKNLVPLRVNFIAFISKIKKYLIYMCINKLKFYSRLGNPKSLFQGYEHVKCHHMSYVNAMMLKKMKV